MLQKENERAAGGEASIAGGVERVEEMKKKPSDTGLDVSHLEEPGLVLLHSLYILYRGCGIIAWVEGGGGVGGRAAFFFVYITSIDWFYATSVEKKGVVAVFFSFCPCYQMGDVIPPSGNSDTQT